MYNVLSWTILLLNNSIIYSLAFAFRYRPLVASLRRNNIIRSSMSKNTSSIPPPNVAELVLEYLSTSGFSESERAFRREMERKVTASSSLKAGSRLEDLLEKSYVTEVASGEFFPRKKNKRSHLDAILLPDQGVEEVLFTEQKFIIPPHLS